MAPGHDHLLHPGCNRSLHEVIRPEHIALKRGVKGHALGRGLPLQARMVHRPRLGGEVLNGVDPLHRPLVVGKHGDVPLNPGQVSKLGLRGTARQQDHLVPLPEGADDKGG